LVDAVVADGLPPHKTQHKHIVQLRSILALAAAELVLTSPATTLAATHYASPLTVLKRLW
jgi:hypothetical protein